MKAAVDFLLAGVGMLGSLLFSTSARADFTGDYALTPPDPGVYFDSGQYGQWEATVLSGRVLTASAPYRLVLEVPTGSLFANSLWFQTQAVADGVVNFDATTVSSGPGYICWFSQTPGANPVFAILDQVPGGLPGYFAFQVESGDIFGFALYSGSDAIPPQAPPNHSLTVEHFTAPVPEPGLGALVAAAYALIIACGRSRSCGFAALSRSRA